MTKNKTKDIRDFSTAKVNWTISENTNTRLTFVEPDSTKSNSVWVGWVALISRLDRQMIFVQGIQEDRELESIQINNYNSFNGSN